MNAPWVCNAHILPNRVLLMTIVIGKGFGSDSFAIHIRRGAGVARFNLQAIHRASEREASSSNKASRFFMVDIRLWLSEAGYPRFCAL